ncbi:CHAT domain-containing protein [Gordonia phthalatica]|uniref:CHAT domain-containing protein n=1 Tax=Gordonia phthalatica TaxID=1136941 RepID=A0A0N9MUW6_9ACTN|nr:CHAT domain-containing protein [Gordonia phthalatica]ALG86430.1 hypothetical protein ACH46_20455 [Gordonia phthalatica]
MSANQYRAQLQRKREQRLTAEKKAGEYRAKESTKRAEAGKAQSAATTTRSESTRRSKLREAERKEKDTASAGKEANRWQQKAAGYAKEESTIQGRLTRAEKSEADELERRRRTEQQQAERRVMAERADFESRIVGAEQALRAVMRQLPDPKPEKLRVLMLGASSEGDLRIGREQKRISAAVRAALHRDQIALEARPAATAADLLDGITGFRPHILHFSGHSDHDLIVLEDEVDAHHEGAVVSAQAFARAIQATDDPPVLVVLNSCNSASQIDELVCQGIPFAIGMADSIDDGDAIVYAAALYSAIANGQSIKSSHLSGQAALALAGLEGADLPILASVSDVDPGAAVLVSPTA